jgi:hypothetical protein
MEPVTNKTKTHAIKRVTSVTIAPEESFVESITVVNNRKAQVRMKSTPGYYYAIEVTPKQTRELIKTAKEGGSIGTFYNTNLRKLPYEKMEG